MPFWILWILPSSVSVIAYIDADSLLSLVLSAVLWLLAFFNDGYFNKAHIFNEVIGKILRVLE